MKTGTIVNWHPASAHGWIRPEGDGLDILFKRGALASDAPVQAGEKVAYTLGTNRRTGKPERHWAARVEVLP
jgi:cold shock CspA family protein